MPAELLLLLIVAFASPSCQVLSSLRMGEALQRPSWPLPPHRPSRSPPWGSFLGLPAPHDPGIWASAQQPPAPSSPGPRSPDPGSLQPQIRESGALTPPPASLRAKESRSPALPPSGPRSMVPNSCVPSAAILDDQTVCGRGERLALALAREQINGIIEVPAKARVEVDIFELQRDSQYETTDTSEQGHRGRGVRQGRLVALHLFLGPGRLSLPCSLLVPSAPSFLSALPSSSQRWCCWAWGGGESISPCAALEELRASFEREASQLAGDT